MFKRHLLSLLLTVTLSACATQRKVADNSQKINAGVNIVPDAVLASMKTPPSTQPADHTQPDIIDDLTDSEQPHYDIIDVLRQSGMLHRLQQAGPYTLFAPTDAAFKKLPPGTLEKLLQPDHRADLMQFVQYHIVRGKLGTDELRQTNGQISTLCGQALIVRGTDNKIVVNDANIMRTDTTPDNGVVHWIDGVLMPGFE